MQRDLKLQAERLNEGEVGVSLRTAQAVVDMDGREANSECIARQSVGLVQEQEQGDGVRTARDSRADAVAGANEFAIQRGDAAGHGAPWYAASTDFVCDRLDGWLKSGERQWQMQQLLVNTRSHV